MLFESDPDNLQQAIEREQIFHNKVSRSAPDLIRIHMQDSETWTAVLMRDSTLARNDAGNLSWGVAWPTPKHFFVPRKRWLLVSTTGDHAVHRNTPEHCIGYRAGQRLWLVRRHKCNNDLTDLYDYKDDRTLESTCSLNGYHLIFLCYSCTAWNSVIFSLSAKKIVKDWYFLVISFGAYIGGISLLPGYSFRITEPIVYPKPSMKIDFHGLQSCCWND